MILRIDSSWDSMFSNPKIEILLNTVLEKVDTLRKTETVLPSKEQVLNAFKHCPRHKLKVVILGQDPYHDIGQAHGLAFSVPNNVKIPPSLRNIYKEIESDIGKTHNQQGDLTTWAQQGVLLLNTTLSVRAHSPASHQDLGWEQLTDKIISFISKDNMHCVFLLWGKNAQTKLDLIDRNKHLVLTAPHPSPLSAHRGFFGCRHFSQTNEFLAQYNLTPIDW